MAKENITLEKIIKFAHSQLGNENPSISVSNGEYDIVDPWYSTGSNGRYLSDDEARAEWGENLVNEFIKKATEYLEDT